MRFKQIKYVLFTLICMCVTPLITHAECDYQRQAELSRLASNVQFNYTYNILDSVAFNLYVTNLTNDIYVVDSYGNYFVGEGEKSLTYSTLNIPSFSDGASVTYQIFSNDNNCKNELLMTKTINFPHYNPLSKLSECTANPGFRYCQVWQNINSVSMSQFEQELSKYTQEKQQMVAAEGEEQNWFSYILGLFENPFVRGTAIFLIIVVVFTIIFNLVSKRKK